MSRFLTIKEMRRLSREIRNKVGIKCRFRFKDYDYKVHGKGMFDASNNTVTICSRVNFTKTLFISLILHELGHAYCRINKKQRAYHRAGLIGRKGALRLASQAWRAERYVDFIASKMMQKHYPGLKFMPGYTSMADKRWLIRDCIDRFYTKEEIRQIFKKKGLYRKTQANQLMVKNGKFGAYPVKANIKI